jgi:hypothetical protein
VNRRDDADQRRPATGGERDRRARIRAGDGEALEQAGGDIRRAEPDKLAVRVGVGPDMLAECPRGQDAARES